MGAPTRNFAFSMNEFDSFGKLLAALGRRARNDHDEKKVSLHVEFLDCQFLFLFLSLFFFNTDKILPWNLTLKNLFFYSKITKDVLISVDWTYSSKIYEGDIIKIR